MCFHVIIQGTERAKAYEDANQFRHRHLSQHYYRAIQCAMSTFEEAHRMNVIFVSVEQFLFGVS